MLRHFHVSPDLTVSPSSRTSYNPTEHAKNIAEPQIDEKLRTIQPQKFKIRTNVENYAILRQIHAHAHAELKKNSFFFKEFK